MPPPRPVLSVPPAWSPRGGLNALEGSSTAAAQIRACPSSTARGWFAAAPTSASTSAASGCLATAPTSASLGPAGVGFPPSAASAASGPSPAAAPTASGFSPTSARQPPAVGPSRSVAVLLGRALDRAGSVRRQELHRTFHLGWVMRVGGQPRRSAARNPLLQPPVPRRVVAPLVVYPQMSPPLHCWVTPLGGRSRRRASFPTQCRLRRMRSVDGEFPST
jgi:hypothetical protein